MVAQLPRQRRLGDGLGGAAANAGDLDDDTTRGRLVPRQLLGDQGQHGPKQAVTRLADGELRGVDAHGQPAGPGREVIAAQRPLPAFVQPALAQSGPAAWRAGPLRAGGPGPTAGGSGSELAIAHLEMRRFSQGFPAAPDPVGDPADHLVGADSRRSRTAGGSAGRCSRSRPSGFLPVNCTGRSSSRPNCSATRRTLSSSGPATLTTSGGLATTAERRQGRRVGVGLPDRVEVTHRQIDRLARPDALGQIDQHAVAHLVGVVEPQQGQSGSAYTRLKCS